MTRSLSELVSTEDPAWPLVLRWVAEATNLVEVLPPAPDAGDVLRSLQVTVRSPLGAIAYHSGGLLIDGGWIRVLGSGHAKLPRSLSSWNSGKTLSTPSDPNEPPGFFLIADDAIGGFFAINGGAFGPGPTHVFYHAPDTLSWESMDRGYTDFLTFCFEGNLEGFYEPYRFQGWREEVSALRGDQTIGVWPPLWTVEGKDIARCSRRPLPVEEVYGLNVIDLPRQLST